MSVYDKIKAGDYESKMPREYVKIPIDPDVMTVNQAKKHEDEQNRARADHRHAVRHDQARLEDQFRADLADEHGITGHPKEPVLWGMVYSHSRSDGLVSMASYYEDLVELVK